MLLLIVALIAVALFYIGGGWFFSNELRGQIDAEQRRADLEPVYDLTVASVQEGSVTLEVPAENKPNEIDTGQIWGLRWRAPNGDTGWGHVGAITAADEATVSREFTHVADPELDQNYAANLTSWTFLDDPRTGLGLDYQDVDVPGELGSYPAWFVPGSQDAWVVIVHGNSLSRLDGMRILANTAALGYPSLVISLRNAPGAPLDPSGMLRYGFTEWRDVEAAVRYALDQGSQGVILAGYSMGGGTIVRFLVESQLAPEVKGAFLDAPMLSFERTIEHNASFRTVPGLGIGVPASLTEAAKIVSQWRFDIDWEEWDHLSRIDQLNTPLMVIHGDADRTVPLATSQTLATSRSDIARLVIVPDAEHVQSWNIDRATYEKTLRDFLIELTG